MGLGVFSNTPMQFCSAVCLHGCMECYCMERGAQANDASAYV